MKLVAGIVLESVDRYSIPDVLSKLIDNINLA